MPSHTARFLRSRPVSWLAIFAALWLIFTALGVVAPSERFHMALPISWLLSGLVAGVWKWDKIRYWLLPICLGAGAIWLVISEQARAIEGVAHADEVVWKMLHIGSVLILFALWAALWQWPPRKLSSPRGKSVARAILRALAIMSFVPFLFATFNVHRTKIGNRFDPKTADNLSFETTNFRAADGARLHGWWIPAARSTRKTVVVCHGVGANASVFLGVAPFLHRAGYNVFFFDFRGHGDSSGHTVSFGWHEANDVRAACKYLQREKSQNALAIYGFSMGGAAVSLSFAPRFREEEYRAVRAVVLDSTFAEFEPLVERQFGMLPATWRPLLTRVIGFWSQLEIGVTPTRIAPRQVIARVAPRPLLIIHGDADRLIPLAQARQLFASARTPKTLVIVPGAGHCLCRLVAPQPYEQQVTKWLGAALK